jgi:hypothetical protein
VHNSFKLRPKVLWRDQPSAAEEMWQLADGVDIRVIQLMLGHFGIKTTQRYLNITDEEMRKALNGVWERRRQLRLEASNEKRSKGGQLANSGHRRRP